MAAFLGVASQLAPKVSSPLYGCSTISVSPIIELLKKQRHVSISIEAEWPHICLRSCVEQHQCLS